MQRLFDVDVLVIFVDIKPRRTSRESGVFAVCPLHGRAGRVAGRAVIERKALFLRPVRVLVAGLHVLVHTGAFRPPVRHAELLPLIDERRALQKQIADSQHFSALHAVLFAAVA